MAMLLLGGSVSALAQDDPDTHPYLSKKYFLTMGVFFPDRKVELSVGGSVNIIDPTQPSPFVDISEQLRVDGDDESAAMEFGWRYGKKWMLRLQHFEVDDSSFATLTEDVEWGDFTFNEGTSVGIGSDVEITRIFFARQFRQDDKSEFGLGVGLHLLDLHAFIQGQAFVDGQDVGFVHESVKTRGPLPNIGAWYTRSLSPNWAMSVRLDWLDASVDKYDGRIVNAAAGINYAFGENFGIGLHYNLFELSVGVNDDPWRGRLHNRFNGAYLYVGAYW